MTKAELIRSVSYATGIEQADVAGTLEHAFNEIIKTVQSGNEVTIRGFCTFGIKTRKAKVGQNISKGQSIAIPAKKVVSVKVHFDL